MYENYLCQSTYKSLNTEVNKNEDKITKSKKLNQNGLKIYLKSIKNNKNSFC